MTRTWTIFALATALAACKGKGSSTTPGNVGDSSSKIDSSRCEGKSVSFDRDKDGKPDAWNYYSGNAISCKQVDFDHDGRKDWLVAYNGSGGTLYQKADFDYDGKYDMVAVFDPGTNQPSEIERDTNFDGKLDVKEIYAGGQLTSVTRSRNADGKPDQWQDFSGGTMTTIKSDDNYDGKVDREEAPTPPAPPPAPEPAPATQPTPPPAATPAPEETPPPATKSKSKPKRTKK